MERPIRLLGPTCLVFEEATNVIDGLDRQCDLNGFGQRPAVAWDDAVGAIQFAVIVSEVNLVLELMDGQGDLGQQQNEGCKPPNGKRVPCSGQSFRA